MSTIVRTALLAGCAAIAAAAQVPDPPKVQFRLISKAIAPGATVKAEVELLFGEGLHGYQNPPLRDYEIPVSVKAANGNPTVKAAYPPGIEIDFAGAKTLAYTGKTKIPITFTAPRKLGTYTISVLVTTQQCNEGNCFPPTEETVKASYKVVKPSKSTLPKQ